MKKKNRNIHFCILITSFILALVLGLFLWEGKNDKALPYEEFKEQAAVMTKFQTLGTNITLHQVIYGTEGTQYRYKLKSDCPEWDYEDRYVSGARLDITGKNAAVETQASSISIMLGDLMLARGQHFYVPLLKLYSEDETYAEFRDKLLKIAYAQYADMKTQEHSKAKFLSLMAFAMTWPILYALGWLMLAVWGRRPDSPNNKALQEKTSNEEENQVSLLKCVLDDGDFVIVAMHADQKANICACIERVKESNPADAHFIPALEEAFYDEMLPAVVVGQVALSELGISQDKKI